MSASEARMTLTRAVTDYFTLWDRCDGSVAIAADLFAEARQNMRDALAAQADQPYGQPQSSQEAREKEITRLATIEECAKMADGWLAVHGDNEIQYTSAREYASDAVADIADAIRALSDTRPDRGGK